MSSRESLLLCLIAGTGPEDDWLDRAQLAKAVASLMQGDNAPADMDYPRAKAFSAALLAELSNDIGSLEESGLVAKSPDNAFFLASAKGRDYIAQLMVDGITKRALQRARSEVLAGDAAS